MAKYFVYTRKSSDSEDKQVLSLESQQNELKDFITREKLDVVEYLDGESKSAKQPGRPKFDRMIKRIERGEADGIIAWHPDRLARNSVDGGKIIYLLDNGKLVDLKFPTYRFENTSQGKFMLNIFFGQSKYYVDSLSENIRRGNKTKLEKGWIPGVPPLGYINDRENRTIVKDEEKFPIVRKMWDLMLKETHTIPEIQRIANEDWGLRTRQHKRMGGKKISLSNTYRLFSNPFYCGIIKRKGETYRGAHEPMVTMDEFEYAQYILGKKEKPKYKDHEFAFTGIIRCGECGAMITAENRTNRYGSKYVYYHCTKRKPGVKCSQRYIRIEDLEKQIMQAIDSITISDQLCDWALQYLRKMNDREINERQSIYKSQQRAYNNCQRQIDELTQMRFKHLVSDEEYSTWKEKFLKELVRLKEKLNDTENRAMNWFELSEKAFLFANKAKVWFENGSFKQKREILKTVGSNFILKDGFLHIQAEKPFCYISKKRKITDWYTIVELIRTFFKKREGYFHIPNFSKAIV